MFYEYAMDPAVISNWQSTRYFLDAFGPWKGRFIASFPKTWKRQVYKGLSCPEVEKKRIEERLRRLESCVFLERKGAPYDGEKPWLDNVLQEHQRAPFRAIIVPSGSVPRGDHILDAEHVDESNPRWKVESGQLFLRDPEVIARALHLLLINSKKIAWIDPYFRADQSEKTEALVTFCNQITHQQIPFDIHSCSHEKMPSFAKFEQDAKRYLPKQLPDGFKVTLYYWNEYLENSTRFHNRYLLTDIGGVQFGDGIERGNSGETDRISILSEKDRLSYGISFTKSHDHLRFREATAAALMLAEWS